MAKLPSPSTSLMISIGTRISGMAAASPVASASRDTSASASPASGSTARGGRVDTRSVSVTASLRTASEVVRSYASDLNSGPSSARCVAAAARGGSGGGWPTGSVGGQASRQTGRRGARQPKADSQQASQPASKQAWVQHPQGRARTDGAGGPALQQAAPAAERARVAEPAAHVSHRDPLVQQLLLRLLNSAVLQAVQELAPVLSDRLRACGGGPASRGCTPRQHSGCVLPRPPAVHTCPAPRLQASLGAERRVPPGSSGSGSTAQSLQARQWTCAHLQKLGLLLGKRLRHLILLRLNEALWRCGVGAPPARGGRRHPGPARPAF